MDHPITKVLVPIAEGFEELEAVTIIDLLRRANIEVISAGLKPGLVKGSRGTQIMPDTTLEQIQARDYAMIVLPGGQPGSRNLGQDTRIIQLLQIMANAQRYVCAICAAPTVLLKAGLLAGKNITCYPGALNEKDAVDLHLQHSAVEIDGKIITSRGPGTAIDFALTLIEVLRDKTSRMQVETQLVRT